MEILIQVGYICSMRGPPSTGGFLHTKRRGSFWRFLKLAGLASPEKAPGIRFFYSGFLSKVGLYGIKY